jgi:hypothetical protein
MDPTIGVQAARFLPPLASAEKLSGALPLERYKGGGAILVPAWKNGGEDE